MAEQSRQADQLRRMRRWQAHVTAQKESGLSRAEYCRQHQLILSNVQNQTLAFLRLCEPSKQPNIRQNDKQQKG
jgi:hypothetical protein